MEAFTTYTVIQSFSISDLQKDVEIKLSQGYVLIRGVNIGSDKGLTVYIQALAK